MTCPTKRNGSEKWYYRRRIPNDVQAILANLPKTQRPRNWFKAEIAISLGTTDRTEAKAKCPEVAAEVEKMLAALRAGPQPLTPKQISALSGDLYKAFAWGLEDNPVITPAQWTRVAEMNEEARRGEYGAAARLGIGTSPHARRRTSMEARFGALTDAFLLARGIITDAASRWSLIEWGSKTLSEAAKKLARNADGDFTPDDEYVKRFAKVDQHSTDVARRSLTALAEAWHKAALDRDVIKRDADRIKSRFLKLIDFLKHDNADQVTRTDIVRWRDHRLAEKKSVKTINASDIASFSNVFAWGAERGWLNGNPAEDATIKTKRQKAKNRDEFFSAHEIAAVLLHAASTRGTKRENPKTTAAKRWVPWLTAYSGARVAEMIQLRKGDIRRDREHGWILRLAPEAGNIKTNKFCDVPIHEHLIAEGFLDFVSASRDGHLFCELGTDGTITGPAAGVYKRVRDMVREVIKDGNIAPNHAWRYTFKTLGLEAGIQEITLDAISNHAPKHQGGKYTKVTLKTRAEAMVRFPRYKMEK